MKRHNTAWYNVVAEVASKVSSRLQGGAGSAAAVGLTGCQQACEMAQPECGAIAYNADLQACFLKQGPSGDTCQVGVDQEQTQVASASLLPPAGCSDDTCQQSLCL